MNPKETNFQENDSISFDRHIAGFLCRQSATEDPLLFMTVALLSKSLRDGHICMDLTESALTTCAHSEESCAEIELPDVDTWKSHLLSSGIAGIPGDYKPLIIDNNRLYFHRRWKNEQDVAAFLLSRTTDKFPLNILKYKDALDNFFISGNTDTDYQKLASILSLANRLCVISGGPGTGKTTTVVKILALQCIVYGIDLHIGIAAPTGKAAARLSFSISQAKKTLPCSDEIKEAIPSEALTIHRLLGKHSSGRKHGRIYGQQDHLPFDIIVIDEASMIDLSLMSKLVCALKPQCRLIMLGDMDQLSSVEAGSVLGDICDTGTSHSYTPDFIGGIQSLIPQYRETSPDNTPFANCIVTLKKSYRFDSSSSIGRLSRAVNDGDFSEAMSVLSAQDQNECVFVPYSSEKEFHSRLASLSRENYGILGRMTDPQRMFSLLDTFKILCAVREGIFGVESVNRFITSLFHGGITDDHEMYHGKPILVTGNDYRLNVFNGDTGIFVKSTADSSPGIAFRNQDGTISLRQPFQIRKYESAYAMTIHKSQGSEFDTVLVILPQLQSPVLTRELLYTAVTRAKKKVIIWGSEQTLKVCISSKIRRDSGLREKLWSV